MTEKLALDIPVLLPDAIDSRDLCVRRLMNVLQGAPGIDQLHIVDADGVAPARVCLHYDPNRTNVARIRGMAEATGARLTEQYQHVLWTVDGLSHVRKARSVGDALRRIDGVLEAEVVPGLVRVELDRSLVEPQQLRTALRQQGVTVSDGLDPGRDHDHPEGEHEHGGPFGAQSELIFAIASGALWTLGFVLELASVVPDGALTGIFISSGLLGGWFTSKEAITSLRNRRFEIDFLMLVAAVGAASLGKWEEGALLLALFSIGHALEGYAMGRARRAIEALADLAPATALVRDVAGEREVPVEELAIGDVVVVKPNERIPADGFVIVGSTSVNQASLTGESIPVDKIPVTDIARATADPDRVMATSRVFSGTLNGTGQIDVQVTRVSADSTLSRLATMVREAETQASPTQQFTDRFERIFVPAVLSIVVVVLAGGALLDSSFSDSFYRAMAVLVAASPCALAIATPSAVLAAVARAGQFGVLVKGGGPLENLGRLDAVAFDKTGTLTEGRPRLTDVVPAEGVPEQELLAVAVAVERRSDHPLAETIARDGSDRLTGESAAATEVTAVVGRGVRAMVGSDAVLIGNMSLFEDSGGVDPEVAVEVGELQAAGRTIMIVKLGDRFLGVLGLMDTPRPEARAAIAALREVGIRRAIMLSGDHQLVADSIAREVGLTDAWGGLMPEDKVVAVEHLRKQEGRVAMVGDGVNDAPALAHATVGIAMGAAGSDVALETADIALMGDDLTTLPAVIGLSRRASRVIRQNLYLSLGMVAFLIPATVAGVLGIGLAVVFHEGSTLVVVGNALRLLGHRRQGPSRPAS